MARWWRYLVELHDGAEDDVLYEDFQELVGKDFLFLEHLADEVFRVQHLGDVFHDFVAFFFRDAVLLQALVDDVDQFRAQQTNEDGGALPKSRTHAI